jgi:hypothetical protein
MTAAATVDPVFWLKNASGMYHATLAKLAEEERDELDVIVSAFAMEGEDAESELTELEVASFPVRTVRIRFNKILDRLTKRTEVQQGGRTLVRVQPHNERIDFFRNALGGKVPTVTRALNVLLSMPVAACAAEGNWSKWGATFLPNRDRLGLDTAEKLIFVQQNDPTTRTERRFDILVD